jgi:hypothetical protein
MAFDENLNEFTQMRIGVEKKKVSNVWRKSGQKKKMLN